MLPPLYIPSAGRADRAGSVQMGRIAPSSADTSTESLLVAIASAFKSESQRVRTILACSHTLPALANRRAPGSIMFESGDIEEGELSDVPYEELLYGVPDGYDFEMLPDVIHVGSVDTVKSMVLEFDEVTRQTRTIIERTDGGGLYRGGVRMGTSSGAFTLSISRSLVQLLPRRERVERIAASLIQGELRLPPGVYSLDVRYAGIQVLSGSGVATEELPNFVSAAQLVIDGKSVPYIISEGEIVYTEVPGKTALLYYNARLLDEEFVSTGDPISVLELLPGMLNRPPDEDVVVVQTGEAIGALVNGDILTKGFVGGTEVGHEITGYIPSEHHMIVVSKTGVVSLLEIDPERVLFSEQLHVGGPVVGISWYHDGTIVVIAQRDDDHVELHRVLDRRTRLTQGSGLVFSS